MRDPVRESLENDAVAADPLIGKVISERYRVLERIGHGGFGAVYRVQHIRLDKTLALKVLFEHSNQNPRMIKRFEREARATCRIGHDNIVQITDFARDRRVGYYFVMEHLAGETLADRLRKLGPMSPSRMVHVASQIADALAATHGKGIVHRDLKPDNIFLVRKRTEDFVKVLDFGIAAMGDMDEQMPRLTRQGTMLGTPAYMSPEQAEGKAADARSDIYSLGIILYEMATGQVPYRNAASMAVLEMHRSTQPIPPRQARPDLQIPVTMERIILRALRKQVGQRYQSMREIYNDLVTLSKQLDMSEVASNSVRPQLQVDGPPTPVPDDIEPEEPEWLDEDLVLLDDDDDDDPGETIMMATPVAQPMIIASSPTGGTMTMDPHETQAMEIGDDDIIESIETLEDAPALVPLSARAIYTQAVPQIEEPAWATPAAVAPTPRRANKAKPVQRKPSSSVARAEKKSKTRAVPLWQRPAFLIAASFIFTLGIAGLVKLAMDTESAPAPTAPAAVLAETGQVAETDRVAETGQLAETRPVAPPAAEAAPELADEPETDPEESQPDDEPLAEKPEPRDDDLAGADVAPALEAKATDEPETPEPVAAGPAAEPPLVIVTREPDQNAGRRDRGAVEVEFSSVELRLESNPPGATVFNGKDRLGTTPFEVMLDKTEQPKVTLRFELPGHTPRTRKVALDGDQTVVVKLRKPSSDDRPRRPSRPKRSGRSGNAYEMF